MGNPSSQYDVESRLYERWAEVEAKRLSPKDAFSEPRDWTLPLAGTHVVLDPLNRRWMAVDEIHDDWVPTPHGVGACVLLEWEGRLLQAPIPPDECVEGVAVEWIVVRRGNEVTHGPMSPARLASLVESGEIGEEHRVWSTRRTTWRPTPAA